MARHQKKTGKPTAESPSGARQGRPAVAPDGARPHSEPQRGDSVSGHEGFEEAPQPALEGAPVSGGSVEDWVRQLEEQAAREQRDAEMRDIRSKAGKHRKKAEKKTPKPDPVYTVGDKRTGGGVSIGGTNDPRERAAAGLNPVAGLDVGLEEAEKLASTTGVTATVEALKNLIDSGNPLFKDGKMWVPHRPERPEKSEGGIALKMVTDYAPAGDQPTAISDLVEGLGAMPHLPLDGGGRAEGAGGGDSAMGPPPSPLPRKRGRGTSRRPHPSAARRHRLRQDLHHGQGD